MESYKREFISFLENAARIGLPIPEKIKTVLGQLHNRAEQEDKPDESA